MKISEDILNLKDYKKKVLEVLNAIDMFTNGYVNLILGTTAVESNFGNTRRQIGFKNKKGGGYGINQIELITHNWIMNDWIYLEKYPDVKKMVMSWYDDNLGLEENLILNDNYNIAICRLKYASCPFELSDNPTVEELARVWKKWYNTSKGKGTEQSFIDKYNKYILI
jgi:hypothetical protein